MTDQGRRPLPELPDSGPELPSVAANSKQREPLRPYPDETGLRLIKTRLMNPL